MYTSSMTTPPRERKAQRSLTNPEVSEGLHVGNGELCFTQTHTHTTIHSTQLFTHATAAHSSVQYTLHSAGAGVSSVAAGSVASAFSGSGAGSEDGAASAGGSAGASAGVSVGASAAGAASASGVGLAAASG